MSKRLDGPRKRPKLKARTRALAQQRRRGALSAEAAWMPQLRDQAFHNAIPPARPLDH